MVFLFSACGKGDDSSSTVKPGKTGSSSEVKTETISNWNKLSNSWNGEQGVYTIEPQNLTVVVGGQTMKSGDSNSKNYSLVKFFDYKTLATIVLCNKPDCKHDDDSCNAYFATPNASMISCVLFGLGDKMYIINSGTIYSMNEDGTDHEKIIELPQRYTSMGMVSHSFLVGDKVYMETQYFSDVTFDKNGNPPADDNGYRTVLFEIDVKAKTYKQLYEYKTQDSTEWLGIIGGQAYYLYQDSFQELKSHTQAALDEQYNGRTTKVFSKDLTTGNTTDLFSGKSNEYDQIILRGNFLFYQDRETGEIVRYDSSNGEKKTLVSNISTYIKFLIMDIQNNKLFYTIDNHTADAYNKKPKDNETYFVDISTGENTKITYHIPCDNGTTNEFNGFTKETPDYFILPVKYEMGTQNYVNSSDTYDYIKNIQFGKMSKTDFWNGKYTLQDISWDGDLPWN
jgi:hypothetical protein